MTNKNLKKEKICIVLIKIIIKEQFLELLAKKWINLDRWMNEILIILMIIFSYLDIYKYYNKFK